MIFFFYWLYKYGTEFEVLKILQGVVCNIFAKTKTIYEKCSRKFK